MKTDTEKLLVATDQERILDAIAPIRQDHADVEVYASHRSEQKAWRFISYTLAATTVIFALGFYASARRGPEYKFVGIDQYGNGGPIGNSYTPRVPEVKRLLTDWAVYRYTRNPKIASTFSKNYLFLSNGVYSELKAQDEKDDVIAKAVSGATPIVSIDPNDVQVLITEFGPKAINGKTYWGGQAAINILQTVGESRTNKPHKDHWIVGVTFVVNMDQVGPKTAIDPNYEKVNFIGLTIVSKPQENHIEESH